MTRKFRDAQCLCGSTVSSIEAAAKQAAVEIIRKQIKSEGKREGDSMPWAYDEPKMTLIAMPHGYRIELNGISVTTTHALAKGVPPERTIREKRVALAVPMPGNKYVLFTENDSAIGSHSPYKNRTPSSEREMTEFFTKRTKTKTNAHMTFTAIT